MFVEAAPRYRRRIVAIQGSEIIKLLRTSSVRRRKHRQSNARLRSVFFGFGFSSDVRSMNLLALWMDDFLITTRPWIFVRLMGNGIWESGKFHRMQMIRRSI